MNEGSIDRSSPNGRRLGRRVRPRVGVDLGGTKIEAAVLDDGGDIIRRDRVLTPQGDYDETIAAIVDLVHKTEAAVGMGPLNVGVATPGAISPVTGRIKNANSTALNGHFLDRDLSAALEREVRISNDANCFVLSEATDGAAAHGEVVFGVILGTGVGGGITVAREVLRGPNAIAGEWGHNPLPWPRPDEAPGTRCYCGRNGCIETFLSGRGLARDFAIVSGQTGTHLPLLFPPEGRRTAREGVPPIRAEDVIKRLRDGDPLAIRCFERYVDRLARALAAVLNVLDPDVVVFGGGMSNVTEIFEQLPECLPRYVFSDHVATELVAPRHGDSSGVRGAAWLWPAA